MSKAVKQSILILVVLLVVSIAVALLTLLDKQKLQNQAKSLSTQLADSQTKQSELLTQSSQLKEQVQVLNDQLADKEKERSKYQSQYDELKSRFDGISSQVDQMSKERDDWKDRASTITQERDKLVKELKDRPEKVVEKIIYKEKEPTPVPLAVAPAAEPAAQAASATPAGDATKTLDTGVVAQAEADSAKQQKDELHWADVLKEKAALEIELEKTKKELDQSAIQIVEFKKQGSDLQLEINKLKTEREEILRKIKYGEDLADNLSIELARAKNDQTFIAERADKVTADNGALQTQVKQLTTTKLALEKTIARLTDDKEAIQKKLIESESIIQSRLNDISKIRQNIDTRMQNMSTKSGNQVELAPIVVNADGAVSSAEEAPQAGKAKNNQGHIVSINTDNNFVIIDKGEKDGVKIGNAYRVYRGNKEVAKVEVIQVRRDIAAADIKKKATTLQVGDIVR